MSYATQGLKYMQCGRGEAQTKGQMTVAGTEMGR